MTDALGPPPTRKGSTPGLTTAPVPPDSRPIALPVRSQVHGRRTINTLTRTLTTLFSGPVLLALFLSGCSTGPEGGADPATAAQDSAQETDASDQSSGDTQGEATFSAGGREFTVALTTCGVHGEEVVLSGHATEVGGDATGFLDGDLTTLDSQSYGEFRIDIGADGPFQSTDDFIALGDPTGGDLSFSEEAHGYVITADAWNTEGDDLGAGSLIFTCS